MGKFLRTGWGFAKKGTKILRHWGSKEIRHSEALAEESLLKGTKILRHYGTKVNLPLPTGEVDFVSERSEFTKSGEGSIFKVRNGTKKKCAFTLSEVLIVLAVLGVIAAMTIPDLIQDYREKALITALKKSYTVFSQAVDMAMAENGAPDTWDISSHEKLYDILKPYLRIEKDCGSSKGCMAKKYAALFNDNFWLTYWAVNYGKGVLASGASFCTITAYTGCPHGYCGVVDIDVNGEAGPNKAGMDLFGFYLIKDGLIPAGQQMGTSCYYNDTSTKNGTECTWWVLKHENMDYLRKDGCYTRSCE